MPEYLSVILAAVLSGGATAKEFLLREQLLMNFETGLETDGCIIGSSHVAE
jgi:hypothetical protein